MAVKVRHPGLAFGKLLRTFKITQGNAAKVLGISRLTVNEIAMCRRNITPSTALRIAKVFAMTPEHWIEMQWRYDLAVEEDNLKLDIDALVPLTPKNRVVVHEETQRTQRVP